MERKKIGLIVAAGLFAGTAAIGLAVNQKIHSTDILTQTPEPQPIIANDPNVNLVSDIIIPAENVSNMVVSNPQNGMIYEAVPSNIPGVACTNIPVGGNVFRAVVNMKGSYSDGEVGVYSPEGQMIGRFNTDKMPGEKYNLVQPGTKVCVFTPPVQGS